MDEDLSGDDLSDSDILRKCEQQLNEMGNMGEINQESGQDLNEVEMIRTAEKRKEREDDFSEDDFITVRRRNPKLLIRSNSTDVNNVKVNNKGGTNTFETSTYHEVIVTSLNNLPKPIAMAKLLRSENIKDILKIKYKSSYKMTIHLQTKDDAKKIIENKKLKDMGLRCQLVHDMSTSYGIVKGIDLDLDEEELTNILNAEAEILAIKRLKRLTPEGNWIDCESVRVSFKGNVLPQYIYAYDCRFKVDPYVFPVTQCSGCWQFGHIIKYCPTKKILCPKCGGNHENCTIKDFTCLNCKGNHFVLDKTCPVFRKEKSIRIIMSEKQVTYRRALQLYMEKKETQNNLYINDIPQRVENSQLNTTSNAVERTYRDVLTKAVVHQQPLTDMEEDEGEESEKHSDDVTKEISKKNGTQTKKILKKGQHKSNVSRRARNPNMERNCLQNGKEENKQNNIPHPNSFEWTRIWTKLKNIYYSELKL
ncbi:uncharacterized protein LOC111360253 [Spodoptera litura]|uniref:Uncharacterized protein LOC111360253 n=1 Tax=Spodoptera litura TaxID=69820 RepID=A0A9J7J098_SPOLT|nr:uncharacterized protein LOC111360253 [Spodoptera litura]